jgi:hypothetical protein
MRASVVLQPVARVDVQAHIPSVRTQRGADRAQDAARVGGVVDYIEGRDDVVVAGDSFGRVTALEADPVRDPGGFRVRSRCGDRILVEVVANVAAGRVGLREPDQCSSAPAADVGHVRDAAQGGRARTA